MREMKDSGIEWIGEIPSHWKVGRTKNCYTNHKDIVGNEADNYERLALTLNGVIKRSKVDATGLQPEAFEGYQILQKNELVFKLIDLENVSTSRVGYSPYTGIVSPAYIILNPRNEEESRFGEYFFLSMWQREVFNHMGDDGVRSSLNAKDLLNIPYPLVPSGEKQNIVSFLDRKCAEIDAVIEKTKATIEEYKKLKQSVITEAVTKGIRGDRPMKDSGVEMVGDIPFEWDCMKVSRIATVVRGASPRPAGDSKYFNGSYIPWITVAEVTNSDGIYINSTETYLTEEGSKCSRIVEAGTLLLSNSGATLGVPKITNIKGCINDGSVAFYNLNIDKKYLLYVFASYTEELRKQRQGYGQPNLNTDLIKALYVPKPSTIEQQEIVDYLDVKCAEIDTLIAKKTALLEEMETYKKSVIYEYVTGKKEVK